MDYCTCTPEVQSGEASIIVSLDSPNIIVDKSHNPLDTVGFLERRRTRTFSNSSGYIPTRTRIAYTSICEPTTPEDDDDDTIDAGNCLCQNARLAKRLNKLVVKRGAILRYALVLFLAKFIFSGLNNIDYISFALVAEKHKDAGELSVGLTLSVFNLSSALVALALTLLIPAAYISQWLPEPDSILKTRLLVALLSYSLITAVSGVTEWLNNSSSFLLVYNALMILKGIFYSEGFAVISLAGCLVFEKRVNTFKGIDMAALLLGDLVVASVCTSAHRYLSLSGNAFVFSALGFIVAIVCFVFMPKVIPGSSRRLKCYDRDETKRCPPVEDVIQEKNEEESRRESRENLNSGNTKNSSLLKHQLVMLLKLITYPQIIFPLAYTLTSTIVFISCVAVTINLIDELGKSNGQTILSIYFILYNLLAAPVSLFLVKIPSRIAKFLIPLCSLAAIPVSLFSQPSIVLFWNSQISKVDVDSVYVLVSVCTLMVLLSLPGMTLNLSVVMEELEALNRSSDIKRPSDLKCPCDLQAPAVLALNTLEMLGRVLSPSLFKFLLATLRPWPGYGAAFICVALLALPICLLDCCHKLWLYFRDPCATQLPRATSVIMTTDLSRRSSVDS